MFGSQGEALSRAQAYFSQDYFTKGMTREYWIIGVCVGANFALIVFCIAYLVFEYRVSNETGTLMRLK